MEYIHTMNPVIESSRLYLKRTDVSDVSEKYISWLNDTRINRFLELRFEKHTLSTTLKHIKSVSSQESIAMFSMYALPQKIHIGNIKLGDIRPQHGTAEIGILIGDSNYLGRGYGTESIGLVSHLAFNKLGLRRLMAGCYENNLGSIKAFEKNGFVREGLLRSHAYYNGTYVNVIRLGLLKSEWTQKLEVNNYV